LGVLARFCKSTFWKFNRSNLSSIDQVLQNFQIFQAIPHEFCHSSLIDLQNIKTQKLTKASENNKAKGLTNVNQGVQIHNIWHSSVCNWLHSVGQNHFLVMMLLYSIIHPDDKNFSSGPSSVSRSFELFQVASVRMSQQHVRTPFSLQPVMGFLSKTLIWEDNCNCLEDVCSRSDALHHKASRTSKVQLS